MGNTQVEINSDFYKTKLYPFNLTCFMVFAIVFSGFLAVIIILGKKKNKVKNIWF